jgi:uncharacterized damage-inducible protein DinB
MFRHLDDFRSCWQEECAKTLEVFKAIPDEAMGVAVAPEHRDLRRLAWHLVETLIEMPGHCGLEIVGAQLIQDGFIVAPPRSMQEVSDTYAAAADSLLEALRAWTDGDLETEDEMYGDRFKRGTTLFILVMHQAHHRGQMTVLMRQAGLKVPGLYGPAKEGWAAFGMAAPSV